MYCTDPNGFLMRVLRSRGANPGEVVPLTGKDGGQGFLKVGLVVNEPKEDSELDQGGRSKYVEVCSNLHFLL